jgi:hypothetical protein
MEPSFISAVRYVTLRWDFPEGFWDVFLIVRKQQDLIAALGRFDAVISSKQQCLYRALYH